MLERATHPPSHATSLDAQDPSRAGALPSAAASSTEAASPSSPASPPFDASSLATTRSSAVESAP
jgi:hypothetical protein